MNRNSLYLSIDFLCLKKVIELIFKTFAPETYIFQVDGRTSKLLNARYSNIDGMHIRLIVRGNVASGHLL